MSTLVKKNSILKILTFGMSTLVKKNSILYKGISRVYHGGNEMKQRFTISIEPFPPRKCYTPFHYLKLLI